MMPVHLRYNQSRHLLILLIILPSLVSQSASVVFGRNENSRFVAFEKYWLTNPFYLVISWIWMIACFYKCPAYHKQFDIRTHRGHRKIIGFLSPEAFLVHCHSSKQIQWQIHMHATHCIRWRCKWLLRPNAMWLILIWKQSGNNWHETVKWVWHVEGALSSLCSNMFFAVLNVHIHLVVQDTSEQGEVLSLCGWKGVVYRSLNVVWNTLKIKSTSRFEDSSSLFFFFFSFG